MKTTCEIMSQKVLPAIRAEISRIMIAEYGCTQQYVAETLGLSRAAVSQYRSEKRGAEVDFAEDAMKEIKTFSAKLIKGLPTRDKMEGMCNICKLVQKSGWLYKNAPDAGYCCICGDSEYN